MNLHRLSILISELEGKKEALSIAQIKEVLRCLGTILYKLDTDELSDTLSRMLRPIGKAKAARKKAR